MTNCSKRRREGTKPKIRTLGEHKEFLKRITKSLYYGNLPDLPCLSLPVTELSADLFSEAHRGRSLKRLHLDDAAEISNSACVSPCSLVMAILYLERLRSCNPEYVAKMAPSELFLVSLMISNKFLQDDGEEDVVFTDEWAVSGNIEMEQLKQLERDFLQAIDWRVYISEDAFENGLSWLEEQVAQKQILKHGFCTYTDLDILTRHIDFLQMLKALTSTSLLITLSYVTSLLTVITTSLLISDICRTSLDTSVIVKNNSLVTIFNDTLNISEEVVLDDAIIENNLKCCTQWNQHLHSTKTRNTAYFLDELKVKDYETWWPRISVQKWLYQNSLITPLHNIYEGIVNLTSSLVRSDECDGVFGRRRCENDWMNLGSMGPLIVSMSDR